MIQICQMGDDDKGRSLVTRVKTNQGANEGAHRHTMMDEWTSKI